MVLGTLKRCSTDVGKWTGNFEDSQKTVKPLFLKRLAAAEIEAEHVSGMLGVEQEEGIFGESETVVRVVQTLTKRVGSCWALLAAIGSLLLWRRAAGETSEKSSDECQPKNPGQKPTGSLSWLRKP
ncbi:uncharacterized protein LOC126249636 [Schistocerca nitens]|uniref:uncharacterized protein LOC126249636 n=1 Tax=Schistocerca nitens TaxID=7011 RepID=UPI002117E4BC|nr:uncharacterized protein LOC126249636 [Schistocerca nitens]